MSKKVNVKSLKKDKVRLNIPFINKNGETENIVINNITKPIKEEICTLIWKGMEDEKFKLSNEELIEFLIDKLTNIELEDKLELLLEEELSYEMNLILFTMTEMLTELMNEILMNVHILSNKKVK